MSWVFWASNSIYLDLSFLSEKGMIELNNVQGLSQLQQFKNMAVPREGALLIKVDKKA